MDWDKLRIFHAVAQAGSVTHAAEQLHTSQPAVSRKIRQLEHDVGSPLFHRHPRGLLLTSEGEILYETTEEIIGRLQGATARIRGNRDDVYGAVRLSAPLDFGTLWLMPRLKRLFAAHPGLTLDLDLSERVVDLPMREADAAIRLRAPSQADVIARRLRGSPTALYASQTYLEARGRPATLESLRDHDLVVYSPKAPQPSDDLDWLVRERRAATTLRPTLCINSFFGVLRAISDDVGIGLLPGYLVENTGLVRILPEFAGPELELYFVYANEMKRSKRVSVLRSFIEAELREELGT